MSLNEFDLPLRNYDNKSPILNLQHINNTIAEKQYYSYKPKNLNTEFQNNCAKETLIQSQENNDYKIMRSPSPIYKGQLKTERVTQKSSLKLSPRQSPIDLQIANESLKAVQNTDRATDSSKFKIVLNQQSNNNINNQNLLNNNTLTTSNISKRNLQSICRSKSAIGNIQNTSVSYSNINMPHHINFPLQMPHPSFNKAQYLQTGLNMTNLNDSLEQLNMSSSLMAGTFMAHPQYQCTNCGFQITSQITNECSIDYISKINDLKKILRKKEQEFQKQTAILKQQVHLLEMQATEYEQREEKMKRNHESMLKAYKAGGNFDFDGQLGTISEMETLRLSRDELKKSKDNLETTVMDLQDKLKQKDFEINNLILTNDDKDILNERKVQDLQLDKRNLENKIRRLENQLQRSDQNELTIKSQNQQREIEKLKEKLQESAQEHTQEVIKLRKCQDEFQEQMKCQQQQLEFTHTQLQQKEIQRQNDQNQIERLEEQVKTYERQVEEMEQQVEDLTLQLGVKEQNLMQMQQQIQSLLQQQSQQMIALDGTQIEELTNRFTQLTGRKVEQSPQHTYRADLEIQRLADENDYLMNQIQSQKNTILNQQEQIKQFLNNENQNFKEYELTKDQISKQNEKANNQIFQLQNEIKNAEIQKQQLQNNYVEQCSKFKEQIISLKNQYEQLQHQHQQELMNKQCIIEKLENENKNYSLQVSMKKFETDKKDMRCQQEIDYKKNQQNILASPLLMNNQSPNNYTEIQMQQKSNLLSTSKQSLIYVNGQSCSASQQNISVISGNVINNPSLIQNAIDGIQTANMSHYQHISRLHENDESMITISGGGNVIYPNFTKNQEEQKVNDVYKNMGNSQMSQMNQNNTLNLNWSMNHHKNMPSICFVDAAKSALQEVSAIQGTGITVQDQEDDARHLFKHHNQPSTATNQNLMPTYQSSIATIEGFTDGLVDINKFNNQQTQYPQNQYQNEEQNNELPNEKVEIASSELDLLYSCQKIIDAASSMKCIKCERIFYTTDFYDHIIVQRECIIFESENGNESFKNQGANLLANKLNNEDISQQIRLQENFKNYQNEIECENYEMRSSNCNINTNDQAESQIVASYDMPLQIKDKNNLKKKNQHNQTQKPCYYNQSDPLQVDELNDYKQSDNQQKNEFNEIKNNKLEITNNENLIEEIRPSYLLSADPVTHVQPSYQKNQMENPNFDLFLQNKRISSLSPFGGKTEQQHQNSTSGGDFSKKQIHSNSISKTGKAKKYCNNYQNANGIGKSGSNGGLQVSQYSQGAKNPLSNNNGQQNAQEFGSRSGMAYSRGTGMTGTVNSNILMSLSRSNTSRSNFSGQDHLKDKSNINNNGGSSPSHKPKTNGIFMNDDDNIKYLAANYHRDKSGIPLSNNPNTTQISKNNGIYTEQNMVTDSVATNEQFFYDNAEAARILLAISDRSPTNFSRFEHQLNATGAANSKRTNTKRELQANDLLALKSIKSVGKSSQENLNTEERSFIYKNSTNLINKHMQFNRQYDQENQKNCILSESLRDILNTNDENMIEEDQIVKLENENAFQNNQLEDQNFQKQKQKNLVHKAEMQGFLDQNIKIDKKKDQLMELEKLYELDTSRFEEEYSNLTSSKKKILLKQLMDDEPNAQEQYEIDAIMLNQQINLQAQLQEQNRSDKINKNFSRNGVDNLIQFHQSDACATQNIETQITNFQSNSNYNQFMNVNTKSQENKFNKSQASLNSISQKNMMTESVSKQTDQHQEILEKMGSMVENLSQNSKKNQVKKIGLNLGPIIKKQQVQKIPASRISIVDPNIVSNSNYQIKKELIEKVQQKPKFDLSQKFEQLKQLKSAVNTQSQQINTNQHLISKTNSQISQENQISNRDGQGQQLRKLKLKRNSSKGFQMSKKQLSIDIASSNMLNNIENKNQEAIELQQTEFSINEQKSQKLDQKSETKQILINDQRTQKNKVKLGFDSMKNTQTQKNEKNQQIKLLKEIIKVSKSPQNQYNQFLFGQNKYESQNSFRCIKSENENIFPISDNNQIQSPMSSYFPSQNKKSNVIQVNNKNIEGTIIAEQKSYAHLSENHNVNKRKIQHFRSNIVNQNAIGQISTMSQVSKGSNPSLSQQIEPQMLLNKSDSHNSPLARRIVQNSCGYQVSQGEDKIEKTVEQSQSKQITQVGQIKKQNSLTCIQPQSRLSSENQKDLDTSAAFDINFGSEINSPVSKKMGFAGSTIGKTGGAIGQRVNQSQKKDLMKTGTNFMPKITEEDQMASIYQNQSVNLNEDCQELRELSERNSQEDFNGQESQRHMLGKQKRFVPTLIANQDDKIFVEERIQKYNCDDDENLNDDLQYALVSNREHMNKVQKHNSKNYLSNQVKIDDSLKQKNIAHNFKEQNKIISTLQFTNPSYNTQSQIIYNKVSKNSPHRKNTDYIRQSILQSSDRRNVSYKSNEGKDIYKKLSQQKQEKIHYQKFYGVEEQEFPSFLDDQDFDEFSQNIEGTMKKQNSTMRDQIQNMYSSDLLETFHNLQQTHNQGERQLLKNLQSQILNQPQKNSYEQKRNIQKQQLNQQDQRDTIKIGQNEVYSNPPCIQSSKQLMSNLMFPSKNVSHNQAHSIQNQYFQKQGFSLASAKQFYQDKQQNVKQLQTQNNIISQSQDLKSNNIKNNMFEERKMSQKEVYFNDSDPRQINKMIFNEQSIECDDEHISKIISKYPLKNNESQMMGSSKMMGGMHFKQVMPAKTPNNEHMMQTVRSDFNSFKNYSEVHDHARSSKNKSNSVFARNISSTIQKSSRNNINSKFQNSIQTIGMQDSQAQFLVNSQIKSSNEFFSQIYPGDQAAKSFNQIKFDNNLDKNSQTQSFQEGFSNMHDNFFIQKDQSQKNIRMNQKTYGQLGNTSSYYVNQDKN